MMIHQLQVSYLIEQDRLLVRLNTTAEEEIRLCLTRRMVMKMLPHVRQATVGHAQAQAQKTSHDGADSSALTQFVKQEALQKSDFATPFKNQVTTLPLGDEPLLASTVHITPTADSLRIGFEENAQGANKARSFEITLGPQLVHGFLHLMESALQQADWGITLENVSAPKKTNTEEVFASAEPPKYLN